MINYDRKIDYVRLREHQMQSLMWTLVKIGELKVKGASLATDAAAIEGVKARMDALPQPNRAESIRIVNDIVANIEKCRHKLASNFIVYKNKNDEYVRVPVSVCRDTVELELQASEYALKLANQLKAKAPTGGQ